MPNPNRNDPCPCGSGRKFKRCCANKPAAAPSAAGAGTHLRFHVRLQGIEPPIWRRFLLPASGSFGDLHDAIQDLGWDREHLWQFRAPGGGQPIAGVAPRGRSSGAAVPDARRAPLTRHFTAPGARCVYLYDFGDEWGHDVVLEQVESHHERFARALLGGERRFPPENCGGAPGFRRLQEALRSGVEPCEGDGLDLAGRTRADLEAFDLEAARRRFGAVVEHESMLSEERASAAAEEGGRAGAQSSAVPAAERDEGASLPQERIGRVLDRDLVEMVERECFAAVHQVCARYGLALERGTTRYSAVSFKLPYAVCLRHESGIALDSRAQEFLRRCAEFGLRPSDLGQRFRDSGGTFQVLGLRPRANDPIVCLQLDPPTETPRLLAFDSERVRAHMPRP